MPLHRALIACVAIGWVGDSTTSINFAPGRETVGLGEAQIGGTPMNSTSDLSSRISPYHCHPLTFIEIAMVKHARVTSARQPRIKADVNEIRVSNRHERREQQSSCRHLRWLGRGTKRDVAFPFVARTSSVSDKSIFSCRREAAREGYARTLMESSNPQNQSQLQIETSKAPEAKPANRSTREMKLAELNGKHVFNSLDGHRLQIVMRDEKYMARGRWRGHQFGKVLGSDPVIAGHIVNRMLIEMDDGTFVPSSEARQQRFSQSPPPKHNARSLANAFLTEKRKLKGQKTAQTYGNRLAHVIRFAELPSSLKSWPSAASVNRDFAVELKSFLSQQEVTRNGSDDGERKPMSPSMVRHCLETACMLFNWAARTDVRQLPQGFANPFSKGIIESKPSKDPLRQNPVPVQDRIRMVEHMDAWQLCNLAPALVLPLRFEDLAGATISDFKFDKKQWQMGTRVGGNDFNKGHVNFVLPLPPVLCEILQQRVGDQSDGPMFLSRRILKKARWERPTFNSPEEFESLCGAAIQRSPKQYAATEQDRKQIIRSLLRECGAISEDEVSREIRKLYQAVGVAASTRPYDLRAATTTDMNRAGLRHLELRYLTGHSPKDILNEYTSLDPHSEMDKYFRSIEPLLIAIQKRGCELGILTRDSGVEESIDRA